MMIPGKTAIGNLARIDIRYAGILGDANRHVASCDVVRRAALEILDALHAAQELCGQIARPRSN